jgi:hypothetical protein
VYVCVRVDDLSNNVRGRTYSTVHDMAVNYEIGLQAHILLCPSGVSTMKDLREIRIGV